MTGSDRRGDREVVQPISLDRFGVLLDAYGAVPERWPDGERASALALAAESADARQLMDQARRLDGLLDRLPEGEPSPGLAERILAAAPGASPGAAGRRPAGWIVRTFGTLWPELPAWRPAVALAASLAFGLVTGAVLPADEIGLGPSTDVSGLVFLDFDLDADETLL